MFFQLLEINENKKIGKKMCSAETVFGLLPKLYCEKLKFCVARLGCIVRKKKKKKGGLAVGRVYCNTLRQLGRFCITGWKGHGRQGLYHNTLSVS